MEALNEIVPVKMEQFLPAVIQFKMDGCRLVQICASRLPGQYELSYSFAKACDMWTLRLTVGEDEPVSSITQVYPCAFLQENEVAELFGVKIENISQDYKHKLYRIDREAPFKEKG
ncbi:MAG TPA: NADH-quinone oxidoreductase subunit C [Candidatus Caccousia avistercoris]|nr:NADH-quinone oxidoreductase subunit C [Candidatus Caccousia avistercoris]